jgi:hypothetical protein
MRPCSGALERTLSSQLFRALAGPAFPDGFGIDGEEARVMSMSTPNPATELEQDLRPRAKTLSWMASLSVAAGEMRAAEGYLLELLAWCAFADRSIIDVAGDGSEGPAQS